MQAAAAVEIEEAKAEEARLRQKLKDKDLANKQLTTEKESVKERLNRYVFIKYFSLYLYYVQCEVFAILTKKDRLNSVELELSRVLGSLQSSESQSEVLRSQMDGVALERDDLQVRMCCCVMLYGWTGWR